LPLTAAPRRGARTPLREGSAVRTCVGCGRKAPKDELLRFVARDGVLALGPTDPGRGAYTCPRLACFERAASKHAFSRTLRERVRIDQNRIPLYT
jgi:predicted RNA-binding protein YlxR (DUF448 family)